MMRSAERQHEKSSRRTSVTRWLSAWLFCCLVAITGSAYAQITIPGPNLINTLAGDGTETRHEAKHRGLGTNVWAADRKSNSVSKSPAF